MEHRSVASPLAQDPPEDGAVLHHTFRLRTAFRVCRSMRWTRTGTRLIQQKDRQAWPEGIASEPDYLA